MGACLGVDAPVREAEPFDRTSADQVLLDDLGGIFGLDVAVPDGFGIYDDRRAVLALVEASGFVDANRAAQAGGPGELLKLGMQFALAVGGARRSRSAFRTDIVADEDVVFENGQTIPPESRLQVDHAWAGAGDLCRRTFHIWAVLTGGHLRE